MKKIIIWVVATFLVAGGAGFYAGTLVGKTSRPGSGQYAPGQGGARRTGGFQQGTGFIVGTVSAKTDNSITVQSRDGSSRIIFFGSSVEISKFVAGTPDDIAIGEQVTVSGASNSDGSINAQTIQIRPVMPAPQPGQ